MRVAGEAGFPVPHVVDAGGRDMVMERVEGPTALTEMARRPWTIRAHAATLARLHEQLHHIDAPAGLEHPFGSGTRLLHLDLQPENVIVHPELGPVVLDWEWAAAGPPEADVAHTWLEIATSEVPGPAWQRALGRLGTRAFLRAFLASVDRDGAAGWIAAVRDYRLGRRELTAREREAVARFLPERE